MLFQMMIVLAMASTLIEMMFAARFSIWRKNAHKFKWVNMVVSIFLSFILGVAFSAAGLIALGAALISTVLSVPGYAFLHWNMDTPIAIAQGGNRTKFYWDNFHVEWTKWRIALGDLGKIFLTIIQVITIPVRVIRKVYNFINKYTKKYNAYVATRRASVTPTL